MVILPLKYTVARPPAPNPENLLCTTWGELIDTWMYLCDTGEYWTLREQLKAWSIASHGIALPDGVFEGEEDVDA